MKTSEASEGKVETLARKPPKRTTDKLSLDRICRLLGVSTPEKWDDDNIDSFCGVWDWMVKDGHTEEECQEAEQAERQEQWEKYRGAVMTVAEEVFDKHGLELTEMKRGYVYRVHPNPGRTWSDCANRILATINGYGPFYFSSLREFLDSGPWTPREAVLHHLGWIPDWYEVYEGGKASNRVERRLK
jgi:hypothetical protein